MSQQDKPIRIGKNQLEMLDKICKTNGGGVAIFDWKTCRSLERRGLIQGKKNQDGWAVHTRKGLEFWRSVNEPAR